MNSLPRNRAMSTLQRKKRNNRSNISNQPIVNSFWKEVITNKTLPKTLYISENIH